MHIPAPSISFRASLVLFLMCASYLFWWEGDAGAVPGHEATLLPAGGALLHDGSGADGRPAHSDMEVQRRSRSRTDVRSRRDVRGSTDAEAPAGIPASGIRIEQLDAASAPVLPPATLDARGIHTLLGMIPEDEARTGVHVFVLPGVDVQRAWRSDMRILADHSYSLNLPPAMTLVTIRRGEHGTLDMRAIRNGSGEWMHFILHGGAADTVQQGGVRLPALTERSVQTVLPAARAENVSGR